MIRELASTRSELIVLHVLSPEELDPPLEGDLRLVDAETGEGIDVTADLADDRRLPGSGSPPGRSAFADLAARRQATLRRPVVGDAASTT